MFRLIPYELGKIWRKRSFLFSVGILLLLHLFFMWYTSQPKEGTTSLSAYKAVWNKLAGMDEAQKGEYMEELKQNIDGVCFVQDILAMQGFQNDLGNALVEQELQNNPGRFEQYYDLFQSGDYLEFTSSLPEEQAFINELYEEWKTVSEYGDYLRKIQENKELLGEISIFAGENSNTFSARNLEKSAKDYSALNDNNIRFMPSKCITSAMEQIWTELFLFLSVMLFVGGLITEEKDKKLFFVTRSTRHGILHSIAAKLAALLIHCIFITGLFYMAGLVFFAQSTGRPDMTADVQSIAPYMESNLPISIGGYIILSILTKAFVLFGIGTLLIMFCILSGIAVMPFLVGTGIMGISALLYYLIPYGSVFSVLKYINPVGLLKTENLYGEYLNFNIFGYPISRLSLSVALILLFCVTGISGSLLLFCKMRNMEAKKLRLSVFIPFKPHNNVLCHEGYKICIANHGLIIALVFAVLLASRSLDRTYTPSVMEQYYKDIMTELEGPLTDEKEAIVLSEKKRYEEALQKIEQIEEMVSSGEMSKSAGDALMSQANMTLAFYPAFLRVEEQYTYVKANGGSFVYDTGYLYLFGVLEYTFSIDFLILSIGIILAVSGAVPMEYKNGASFLLCATRTGKQKILLYKVLTCSIVAVVLSLIPIACRAYNIASVYPLHGFDADIQSISHFVKFPASVSIGGFLLLFIFLQSMAAVLIAWLTMAISVWRKNQVQTLFFALLFLVVPMVLKLLGFEAAKWFSLYPLYGWTGWY